MEIPIIRSSFVENCGRIVDLTLSSKRKYIFINEEGCIGSLTGFFILRKIKNESCTSNQLQISLQTRTEHNCPLYLIPLYLYNFFCTSQ